MKKLITVLTGILCICSCSEFELLQTPIIHYKSDNLDLVNAEGIHNDTIRNTFHYQAHLNFDSQGNGQLVPFLSGDGSYTYILDGALLETKFPGAGQYSLTYYWRKKDDQECFTIVSPVVVIRFVVLEDEYDF